MPRASKIALALSLFAATVFTVGLSNAAAADKPTPARSNVRSDEVRVFYKRVGLMRRTGIPDLRISADGAAQKTKQEAMLA